MGLIVIVFDEIAVESEAAVGESVDVGRVPRPWADGLVWPAESEV